MQAALSSSTTSDAAGPQPGASSPWVIRVARFFCAIGEAEGEQLDHRADRCPDDEIDDRDRIGRGRGQRQAETDQRAEESGRGRTVALLDQAECAAA